MATNDGDGFAKGGIIPDTIFVSRERAELLRLSDYLIENFSGRLVAFGPASTVDQAIRVMNSQREENEAKQLTIDVMSRGAKGGVDPVAMGQSVSAGELDGSELNGSVHIQETPHGFGDFIQKVKAARSHKDIVIDDRNAGRKSVDDPVRFRRK